MENYTASFEKRAGAIARRVLNTYFPLFIRKNTAEAKVWLAHGQKGKNALRFNERLNTAINDPTLHKKLYSDWLKAPRRGTGERYPYWRLDANNQLDLATTPMGFAGSRLPDVTSRIAPPKAIKNLNKNVVSLSRGPGYARLEKHPYLVGLPMSAGIIGGTLRGLYELGQKNR